MIMAAAATALAWNVPDESLRYNVRYKWGFINANAGVATLTTRNIPGENRFVATLTGESVDLLGHYYAAGDTISGTIMADTMQPVYNQQLTSENGEFAIQTVTYDTTGPSSMGEVVKTLPGGKVLRSRVSHYGGGLTLDLLSVFYYIRQIDYQNMQPGQSVTVNIFSGTNPETLKVTYQGTGNVVSGGVPCPTYNISLTFSTSDGGGSDSMTASISTDDSRIPLVVDGSLKFGHLECTYLP